jgi:5-hydroxyisourate hydrolase
MSAITTHVLDTTLGRPAQGLKVRLEVLEADGSFRLLAERTTNAQGRVTDLLADSPLEARCYRLRFETEPYLLAIHHNAFYPQIEVLFRVTDTAAHHHIPLLLSPFGYSTYRGS